MAIEEELATFEILAQPPRICMDIELPEAIGEHRLGNPGQKHSSSLSGARIWWPCDPEHLCASFSTTTPASSWRSSWAWIQRLERACVAEPRSAVLRTYLGMA